MKFRILIFILLVCWHFSYSQNNIQFENIGVEEGLSAPTTNQVIKDHQGFLWIATLNGLNRYDGIDFKVFKHNENDPKSLSSNSIRCVLQDSKKYLWVGTFTNGLNRYDYETGTFTHFFSSETDDNSISSNEIISIFEDSQNRLWVGTEYGLNLFDYETETFTSFLPNSQDSTALQNKAVLSISEDHRGWVWVGTWDGGLHLVIPSKEKNQFTFRNFKKGDKETDLKSNHIWTMFLDNQNRFIVGSYNGGISIMLPDEKTNDPIDFEPKFQSFMSKGDYKPLANNVVFGINQDFNQRIWVSTVDGLTALDLETSNKNKNKPYFIKSNQHFKNDFFDPKSLIDNEMRSIFVDEKGILWCATQGGVSKYDPNFANFKHHSKNKTSKDNLLVYSLTEYDRNTVYIGSRHHEGLIEYDIKNNTYKTYYNPSDIKGIRDSEFISFHKASKDTLWIGTRDGLLYFNPLTKQFKTYLLEHPEGKALTNTHVRDIHPSKNGKLWLATGSGLVLFDPSNDSFDFKNIDSKGKSIEGTDINTITVDHNNDMWLATYRSLRKVDFLPNGEFVFKTYIHDPNNPLSICSNRILSLETSNNQLWIGSENGLTRYRYETDDFENFKGNALLKDPNILSILTDNEGELWLSTRKGLIKIDPNSQKITQYDRNDGLTTGGFTLNASCRNADGKLFFGGINGFISFYGKDIKTNQDIPPIYISDIKVFNESRNWSKSVPYLKEIRLKYTDNYFTIYFAALNYIQPFDNQYAYKLEGFNDDWVYNGTQKSVSFSNLDGGTYTFRVKASNNDNIWNEEGVSLKIIIQPPFWKTMWFRITSIILGGLLIFGIYRYRINRVQRKKIALERLVKSRTKELATAKEEVETLLTTIKDKNEELKTTNTELRRSNTELEQFAYIASHDLQEPLRMVGNFVQLLEEELGENINEEERSYVGYIVDGVTRMSQLIDDLLQFSRVGRKDIVYQTVNVRPLIEQKVHDLSLHIKERNAKVLIEDIPTSLVCEPQQLSLVFYNLIHNAIKFNKTQQPIVIISAKEDKDYWTFSVKDNGIGIDPKNQELIFEVFKRLHRKEVYKGTGIGLALCKRIVLRHEGDVWFESELWKGSTFYFTIKKQLKNS